MQDLSSLLSEWNIPYEKFDHPAVFTCEESDRLCPEMPGAHTKQLLMKGKTPLRSATQSSAGQERIILAIVMHDKKVDMRELGRILGAKDLSFASAERLKTYLGVEPGSVTPFGLIFDTEKKVEVIVDEDAWAIGQFRFHPLVNTATLVIDKEGFEKFLGKTGHEFRVMVIPRSNQ
jgi:Ala-tRNA(Pro) deacylase